MGIQSLVWRARRDQCNITISDGDLFSYIDIEGPAFKLEISASEDGIKIEIKEGETTVDIKKKEICILNSKRPKISILS